MRFFAVFAIPALFLFSFTPSSSLKCDEVPELNAAIITYVKGNIGKKVDRGECWDLAAQALNSIGAKWDGSYKFGRQINAKSECIFPGDIIQFNNVTVTYEKDKTFFMEKMEKHTAVIYEVNSSEDFVLADQNTGMSGRKVGLHGLLLKNISTGTFKIYRPEK